MSDFEPFYNVDLSYEDNYARGPFGEFAAALCGDVPAGEAASPAKSSFLGVPVDLPFGIPAGPLLNERFTTAAFRMGFDIATYKTVRSRAWGCNPFPNVLAVHPTSADGSLTPGSAELDEGVLADTDCRFPFRIRSVCRPATRMSGSRTCAGPSRRPARGRCCCRASRDRAWRA